MGRAENTVEHYLVARAKACGATVRKLAWVSHHGAPDRVLLFPGGKIMFVECKSDVGKLSRQQRLELDMLSRLGFITAVVSSKEEVDALLAA